MYVQPLRCTHRRFMKGVVVLAGSAEGVPTECEATLQYNVARCREAQGDLRAAQQGYEQVLKDHPDYTDCIIRLGYMKYVCGHKADAEALFKKCLDVPGGREDALAVLCMIKQRAESWASAKARVSSVCTEMSGSTADLHQIDGNGECQ